MIGDNNSLDNFLAVKEMCESDAEDRLLDTIAKGYKHTDIFPQHKAGRFRIDFVTADGVGWEVDGKDWHDRNRDARRDLWILRNVEEVKAIVRMEASAIQFFRDACLASFSTMVPHMKPASRYCRVTGKLATVHADEIVEHVHDTGEEAVECFAMGEAYQSDGGVSHVGSPLSFVDREHEIWEYVDRRRVALHRWQTRIECRTVRNRHRWA